ncbi:Valyl-tRNA synthetase [Fasciola hepatica]|uniref:valine--tRNA ligase n=1 Tax=Fasciola hepatica TaxID=6192 RepID=A0A4E0RG19_FASHE|nr:Valyl-tRNA synthetase [Fasciola hepatica]
MVAVGPPNNLENHPFCVQSFWPRPTVINRQLVCNRRHRGFWRLLYHAHCDYSTRGKQLREPKVTATDKAVDWRLLVRLSTIISNLFRYPLPSLPTTGNAESLSAYDPMYVEDHRLCSTLWNQFQVAKPETVLSRNSEAPVISMLLPPPNVTGSLHMGHALTCAVQDVLARFNRMQGGAVLWIPGLDHAGIATQAVVERELLNRSQRTMSAPGTTPVANPRLTLGRQAFVEKVWKWKDKQSSRIQQQLKSLGLSLDWSREFFTLDPRHSRAVIEAFIRLYDAGLVYRDNSIVSWCCHFQSAISDIEVDNVELYKATQLPVPGYSEPQTFGIMDYFVYSLADCDPRVPTDKRSIVVATTRLETMLADTALVVHPDDSRYAHLIGRYVVHPFCPNHRRLPIVADAQLVDRSKGTGVVKLSPGHSAVDWEASRRLGLPVLNMIDDAGRVTEVGGEFAGLPRFTARQQLVKRLTDLGLYRKREDIRDSGQSTILPICSRSGDIIEPVVREQWFVRTKKLAEKAVQAVRNGKLRLHPVYQEAVWNEWLSPNNRRDWCISRQLWWGHRIPAFRLKNRSTSTSAPTWLIARNIDEAREKLLSRDPTLSADSIELEQDPDVLDTWFSSALLPFTALGWPDQTDDFERFYPMTLLETGQDILFFWVARMVMLGLELTKSLPFAEVVLHGLVCDSRGQKMSKSKGNVLDPMDLIHGTGTLPQNLIGSNIRAIGADALRASLLSCSLSQPQIAYNVESAVEMRRFCNKIWQTGRFALFRIQTDRDLQLQSILHSSDLGIAWNRFGSHFENKIRLVDWWLIYRLMELIRLIQSTWSGAQDPQAQNGEHTSTRNPYTLHTAIQQLHYWWTEELCSVYLEVVKYREKTNSDTSSALFVLCMMTGLHLLHPVMPHVTELVWQGLRQISSTPTRQHDSDAAPPRMCLAMQPFPREDWFTFTSGFNAELVDRTFRTLSELLHSAAQANAWRALLRPNSNYKPTDANPQVTLQLIGPERSTDTEELRGFEQRIEDLKRQLQSLENCS